MILSIFGSPVIVLQNNKNLFTDKLYNIAIEKLMLPQNKNVTILNVYGPKEDNIVLFDKL